MEKLLTLAKSNRVNFKLPLAIILVIFELNRANFLFKALVGFKNTLLTKVFVGARLTSLGAGWLSRSRRSIKLVELVDS